MSIKSALFVSVVISSGDASLSSDGFLVLLFFFLAFFLVLELRLSANRLTFSWLSRVALDSQKPSKIDQKKHPRWITLWHRFFLHFD